MLIKSIDKVQKLTKRVESFYDDKENEEKRLEYWEARNKEIKLAPTLQLTDFYCKQHGDFKATGYKVVESDWNSKGQLIAYYKPHPQFPAMFYQNQTWGKPCVHCKRQITDKLKDPYYRQSEMIKRQAKIAMANGDLLQPKDSEFDRKYPQYKREYQAKMEKEERANYERLNT